MGIAELYKNRLLIRSHIVTYGNAADEEITRYIAEEIETLWNEPRHAIWIKDGFCQVEFEITGACIPDLDELDVLQNLDPKNNFFRIENYSNLHISFVDGLGCNTGYFLRDNLYTGSTTAAHEYGHTLGLAHPKVLDLRGKGRPGIMYPRGTLVDPVFQYEPDKPAGEKGGTMHPMHRRVNRGDIESLQLHRIRWENGTGIVGAFSNIYHWEHTASPTRPY